MSNMDGPEADQAKDTFERLVSSYYINIKHYHYDNGLFDTKVFKSVIQRSN